MKGYEISIMLEDSIPEISRKIVIPQNTKIHQMEKIVLKTFSLPDDCYYSFPDLLFEGYSEALIDNYINQTLHFEYYVDDDLDFDTCNYIMFIVKLIRNVDCARNVPVLISHSGNGSLEENNHSIALLNYASKNNTIEITDGEVIQKELDKIILFKHNLWEVKINYLKCNKDIWRLFLIPENINFKQLEEIILISFDTPPDSFNMDDELIKEVFKRKPVIYSNERKFRIDIIKKVYSKKEYPILKDYEGGLNPFDMWFEYYPKGSDKFQSSLDEFIN